MRDIDWSKYTIAFIITATVFWGAFYVSNKLNEERLSEVQSIQEQISLDILSSEIQFDLLQEIPCKAINESFLSEELNSLARRMTYTENSLGSDNEEVIKLKRAYFLLEVKDYLLAKRIDERCETKPVMVLYFYSNDCDDCRKEGFVLTKLREKYPDIRVYSFDYDFGSSIVETLISLFDIERNLPVLVVDGEVSYGFKKIEEIEEAFPTVLSLPLSKEYSTTTPTTTPAQ